MTTYTVIADTEIDAESPVTEELMTRLRDNPIAMGEGATGSPRISGKALNTYLIDWAASATTTPATITSLDGFAHIRWDVWCDNSGAVALEISFTNDNGGSWGAYQIFLSLGTGPDIGSGFFNMQTGAYRSHSYNGTPLSGTLTVPSNCNGFRIRMSNTSGDVSMMGWVLGGLL